MAVITCAHASSKAKVLKVLLLLSHISTYPDCPACLLSSGGCEGRRWLCSTAQLAQELSAVRTAYGASPGNCRPPQGPPMGQVSLLTLKKLTEASKLEAVKD